jgi:hypothetical protein
MLFIFSSAQRIVKLPDSYFTIGSIIEYKPLENKEDWFLCDGQRIYFNQLPELEKIFINLYFPYGIFEDGYRLPNLIELNDKDEIITHSLRWIKVK